MRNGKIRNIEYLLKKLNIELPQGSLLKQFADGLLRGYQSIDETAAVTPSDISIMENDVGNKAKKYNQNKTQYFLEFGSSLGKLIAYEENLKIIKLAQQQKEYKTA